MEGAGGKGGCLTASSLGPQPAWITAFCGRATGLCPFSVTLQLGRVPRTPSSFPTCSPSAETGFATVCWRYPELDSAQQKPRAHQDLCSWWSRFPQRTATPPTSCSVEMHLMQHFRLFTQQFSSSSHHKLQDMEAEDSNCVRKSQGCHSLTQVPSFSRLFLLLQYCTTLTMDWGLDLLSANTWSAKICYTFLLQEIYIFILFSNLFF